MPVKPKNKFAIDRLAMRSLSGLLTLTFLISLSSSAYSQCTLMAIPIPDNSTTTIQFSASGLVDNNLSSPTQGICGVEIDFMHEYLGDLTISLVSPAGTIVQLIGPTTTSTSPTNLSRWNIDFVPCSTPAAPDPGFADVWSNLQAWQAITPYTGTYHPQIGCLEDFNTGSANGVWQIIIQDHDQFQIGTIASITLIFCNPQGLNCTECNPNAGTLSPAVFNVCSGENIQSSDITVNFGSNTPSPSLYAYEYLLISGNTILQNGSSFSAIPPIGSYTICGISYVLADTTAVYNLFSNGDYNALAQAVSNGVVCGDLTTSCISVSVTAQPDTVEVTSNLCNGEIFSFGGQDYSADGFYYQVHDGPGLCDTIFEIRISTRALTIVIDTPDTLTCGNGSVDLHATTTGAAGPFTYQWSTQVGNIISPPNGATISVDQAGQYFVDVSDGVCDGSGSVIVVADQGFPQIFVDGGIITCNQTSVSLNPIYIPSDGTVLWTGPSGFMSSQPDITVSVPGTYVLNVTNTNGCATARSIDIPIDTSTNSIDIIIIGKDCQNQELTLGNTFPERLVGWNWTGPNGFTSNYWRPVVTMPGLYTLIGTFPNGCTRAGTFLFDGDFQIPDLTIPMTDTLNCNEVISLTVSSMTAGVSFSWNGPQGFLGSQPTIQVAQEGTYSATVYAPNGCNNQDEITIVKGGDIFDYQVISDTLNCKTDTVMIGVVSADADVFQWINYAGSDGDQSMIRVGDPGVYTVQMTDTNTGCIVTAEVLVYADFLYPSFSYSTTTITCLDPISEIHFVPVPGFSYDQVYWELPDLSVVQGPTLFSGLSGEHRLIGINPAGCKSIIQFHIPFDTIPPFVIFESDTLTCLDTTQIISQSLDSITSYLWSGPGIVTINDAIITADEPGYYHLSVFGLNGCPGEYDVLIDSNFVAPSYVLQSDSLRCDRPATLQAASSDLIVSYGWFDSTGQLLSNDSMLMVSLPGQYTFEIQGANRCMAYDTVILDPLQFPIISLSSDTFNCARTSATLMAIVDIPQFSIAWEDMNGDTLGTTTVLSVMQSGPYAASVSGQNACETRDTIMIPYDTLSPSADIELIGEVRCKERDVMFDGSGSTALPLLYSWTSAGGMILSDPSGVIIQARDTGIYILIVQRLDNSCRDTASFYLQEVPDAISMAFLDTSSPECSGDANASLEISDLTGGIEPFLYQLNGGSPQSSPVFEGLPAGIYTLTISDAKACIYDTIVQIEPVFSFTIDAGPDLEIHLGETITISGTTDLLQADIGSIQWDSSGINLCLDCPDFDVSPGETTTYTYTVTSISGCERSDKMIVYVVEKAKYYIANVFSPNGDGVNDEVRLNPTPGIEKVLQWIIFDRWGDAVFGKTDFAPSDGSVFWNGQTSTGENANPGVFPYLLEVQLINGKIEVFHGDITLLR
jgi:subtilisin-like proprotein convertase family protein